MSNTIIVNTTKENFVKDMNKIRLANKDAWVFAQVNIEGHGIIQWKSYNTWMQIFRYNGLNFSFCMGLTATQFKEELTTFITSDYIK